MPRNYNALADIIAESGFFSEYLPLCFQIDKKVFFHPPTENCDLIAPYCFTMSRYNGNNARRNIFIPEIGSYVVAQQYMKQEGIIEDLIEFTETSNNSFSPILGEKDSISRHEQIYGGSPTGLDDIPSNYIENVAKKIVRSAGATQVLKLDISNCYSSFYMHMIPAIMLGLEATEIEYRKFCKCPTDQTINPCYLKYRKLDEIIRHQNLNRTNGLLPGLLSSKIIAESILTRIDIELEKEGIKFSRYVDDYEVYLYNGESKETILTFSKILRRYGFTLNAEKTNIINFPYYLIQNLDKLFNEKTQGSLHSSDIMEVFDTFFNIEKSGTKGAIRYLLKSIEKSPITSTNPELYKAYLLSIISNNERSLTKACSLLINNKESLSLSFQDIKLITEMLVRNLKCGNDLEVLWLLYLLIKTEHIDIGNSIVQAISNSQNELAQIMLLRKTLLTEELETNIINNANSWILLYELYVSDKIDEGTFLQKLNIKKNEAMYKYLKQNNVHFCSF